MRFRAILHDPGNATIEKKIAIIRPKTEPKA